MVRTETNQRLRLWMAFKPWKLDLHRMTSNQPCRSKDILRVETLVLLASAMGLLKLGEEIFEAWKSPFPAQMGNLCSRKRFCMGNTRVYTIMGQ